MNLLKIFETELEYQSIFWCTHCADGRSHRRGFADPTTKTIHLDRKISTRSTLHRALHEIGHIVNDEKGMLRWQREEAANQFAERRMRELGVPVPRTAASKGRGYVRRMKRWGTAISKARTS